MGVGGGERRERAGTHVEAADLPGGVTGPDHLRQRPHLLHLRGHLAGVREALLREEGSVAGGSPAPQQGLQSSGEARLGKGTLRLRPVTFPAGLCHTRLGPHGETSNPMEPQEGDGEDGTA